MEMDVSSMEVSNMDVSKVFKYMILSKTKKVYHP